MAKHNKKARKQVAPAKHPYASKPSPQQRPSKHHAARPHAQQASQKAPVPFDASDDILLVGEGDFSFAHCLQTHYPRAFNTLTATTLESQDELLRKYPQARTYIEALTGRALASQIGKAVATGEGAKGSGGDGSHDRLVKDGGFGINDVVEEEEEEEEEEEDEEGFGGFSTSPSLSPSPSSTQSPSSAGPVPPLSNTTPSTPSTSSTPPRTTIHYTTDATKLSIYKTLRHHPTSCLIFNFPHVGGKSTDVNRQVRYNQEMLHKFLGEGKKVLVRSVAARRDASKWQGVKNGADVRHDVEFGSEKKSERYDTDDEAGSGDDDAEERESPTQSRTPQPVPRVLVTLFEGEPYTLWNIKDLARSVGLECRRSWKFDWSMWPGYRHARTLGNLVEGRMKGGGELEDGKDGEKARGPGWKGEKREARTYEFGLKDWKRRGGRGGKRKRDGRGSGSD